MRFSQVSPRALPLWLLVTSVLGQESAWLTPDGSKPDFTDAFYNADIVTINWLAMTGGLSDLWVSAVESNYAMRLGSNINISAAGIYPWTVTVGNEEIDVDSHFQLSFVPTGTTYQKNDVAEYVQSPGFVLVKEGEPLPTAAPNASSPATSVAPSSAAPSSSSPATSTPSSTSEPDDGNEVSTGVKAAMGVGIVAAIAIILGLLFWALRLRRKVKAAKNHRSSGIIPSSGVMPGHSTQPTEKRISGLHEARGDAVQPVEMPARPKTIYHELSG